MRAIKIKHELILNNHSQKVYKSNRNLGVATS